MMMSCLIPQNVERHVSGDLNCSLLSENPNDVNKNALFIIAGNHQRKKEKKLKGPIRVIQRVTEQFDRSCINQ